MLPAFMHSPLLRWHSACTDGVIAGNHRCSLAGLDLNRVYQLPDGKLQPVIAAFKEMVQAFMQEREVRRMVTCTRATLCCALHAL
jgi:hypothetical protein